jgi:hypothetical protein
MLSIAQTLLANSSHAAPMSEAAWYWRKAGECAQMARKASDPRRRSDYETQDKLWRQIASRIETIEATERNRVVSDPV